jgi:hypothetical protein
MTTAFLVALLTEEGCLCMQGLLCIQTRWWWPRAELRLGECTIIRPVPSIQASYHLTRRSGGPGWQWQQWY